MRAGDLGKVAATLIGIGLCLAALTAWRLPTDGTPPGLDLRLIAIPPGELAVDRSGLLAAARGMEDGGEPARASMRVENVAGRTVLVRIFALPSVKALGPDVRLAVTADGKEIASGTLASMVDGAGRLTLPPRASRRLEVSAWVAPGASDYRGRILDVTLEPRARPLEAVS